MINPRCIDCDAELVEICIIDRGHGNTQQELVYRMPDAKANFFTGYPIAGKVRAMLCEGCGRISLFAGSKANQLNKEKEKR